MAGASKQTRRRQKIEMKMIEDDEDCSVTFSKRISGIYKKVSELVTMCGEEVGLVVFSSTEKPFSFGHPSVESITNRFLDNNLDLAAVDMLQPMFDAHRRMRLDRETNYLKDLLARLDEAKEKGKALERITHAMREGALANGELEWWEKPVDELSPQELEQQVTYMEAFHKDLCNYLNHPIDLAALGLEDPTSDPLASDDPPTETEARANPWGRTFKISVLISENQI